MIFFLVIAMLVMAFRSTAFVVLSGNASTNSVKPPAITCPHGDTSDGATSSASSTISLINYDSEVFTKKYLANGTQADISELGDVAFVETFRDTIFDGHRRTFQEWKESRRLWVRDAFVPHLKSGMTMYESAAGLGLSLYATLELLQEEANVGDLTVYGNEFLKENAKKGNHILDVLIKSQAASQEGNFKSNHNGGICHADSNNLQYLPANSFDVVYCGWITPLYNPLGWKDESYNITKRRLYQLCQNSKRRSNQTARDLLELAQQKQNEWFDHWISEMVRLAKPGGAIVIEDLSMEFCKMPTDYGGVPKKFFEQHSEKWGTHSLKYGKRDPTYSKSKRYHIVMIKNNNNEGKSSWWWP